MWRYFNKKQTFDFKDVWFDLDKILKFKIWSSACKVFLFKGV